MNKKQKEKLKKHHGDLAYAIAHGLVKRLW